MSRHAPRERDYLDHMLDAVLQKFSDNPLLAISGETPGPA